MNVLVVVAHPDDETLGMGGTIAKHAENGDQVTVACMCHTRATQSWHEAVSTLGASTLEGPEHRDQALDCIPMVSLIDDVTAIATDAGSVDVLYTHNPSDLNHDHRIVTEAVLVASRPHKFRGTILAFETISSTEWGVEAFQPNWYEQLSGGHLKKKMQALNCYVTERRSFPHPRTDRGIDALAKVRGAECGVGYAEAFRLLRRGPG